MVATTAAMTAAMKVGWKVPMMAATTVALMVDLTAASKDTC